MDPVSFAAFADEMVKIAISMQLAEKATARAWRKGLTGSRRMSAKDALSFNFGAHPDSTSHILDMAKRKTKAINPLLHPVERVKAERSLRNMGSNARLSEDAREWAHAHPGKAPSKNPHVQQPGQTYGDWGASSFVVDTPGGAPVDITGPHRSKSWFPNGRAYAARYAHEQKELAAHRARVAALPPEAPVHPARVALLKRQRQAMDAQMAPYRSAAVPQKPLRSATTMPTYQPGTTTVTTPPVAPAAPRPMVPAQRPFSPPTPAAPVQRRPFVSQTPPVRPQQPGVAF